MKKILESIKNGIILAAVWVLFLVSLIYLIVIGFYFPEDEFAGILGVFSTLLLAVSYTIIRAKRRKGPTS